MNTPLAEILRPKKLDDIIGQTHLVKPNAPIYQMIHNQKPQSIILWGPPGVGKTTLAKIITTSFDCNIIELSAIFSGIKEIKEALNQAENFANELLPKPTIIFIDEIHRFNKIQQDAFLHHLENGLITIIGATTENPSFELNKALLSRMQVYVLNQLSADELGQIVNKSLIALQRENDFDNEAKEYIISLSNGDARNIINILQLLNDTTTTGQITLQQIKQILPKHIQVFNKGGEEFYNLISALHKSIRGSNPDASLYWFGRMLKSGTDPLYIGRRLLRIAWEDVGLADINAATVVSNALQTYERLGSPEGELALAGAVTYLASTNKSNSLELAYNNLMNFIDNNPAYPVPIHLRNAPTKLMSELGYGKEYKYAHDYPNHYVPNEQYLPEHISNTNFYTPTNQGFEARISERLKFLTELDKLKQ